MVVRVRVVGVCVPALEGVHDAFVVDVAVRACVQEFAQSSFDGSDVAFAQELVVVPDAVSEEGHSAREGDDGALVRVEFERERSEVAVDRSQMIFEASFAAVEDDEVVQVSEVVLGA